MCWRKCFPVVALLMALGTLSLSGCSSCNVSKGSYTNSGGSEEYILLSLKRDSTYTLKYETWAPGRHENKTSKEFDGQFSCEGKSITLKSEAEIYNAQLVTVGANPIGIDPKAKALQFDASRSDVNHFLSNEVLYLE